VIPYTIRGRRGDFPTDSRPSCASCPSRLPGFEVERTALVVGHRTFAKAGSTNGTKERGGSAKVDVGRAKAAHCVPFSHSLSTCSEYIIRYWECSGDARQKFCPPCEIGPQQRASDPPNYSGLAFLFKALYERAAGTALLAHMTDCNLRFHNRRRWYDTGQLRALCEIDARHSEPDNHPYSFLNYSLQLS
jgi:hypothetical protein